MDFKLADDNADEGRIDRIDGLDKGVSTCRTGNTLMSEKDELTMKQR